ncbi:MAG: hypothetical protein KDK12_00980 [Rhodobacteraceae bacterium]|nr:hypothetical protein [Paracoccaceae bacterium]
MTRRLLLAATFLLPLPAAAQLAPGFWSFPDRPNLPRDELATLCATGFSLVHEDGTVQSFLPVPWGETQVLWQDAEMACQDTGDGTGLCEGWVDDGPGPEARRNRHVARTEGNALRLETRVEGHDGAPFVTYPQPCPGEGVRAALALGLAPRS